MPIPHIAGCAATSRMCARRGAEVCGVLPIRPGVSWEIPLAAALIGLALAIALRRLDIPPRKRYAYEDEEDEYEDD